jgi:hypothetical protein
MATYAILRDGQFFEWRDFDVLPPHRPESVRPQIIDALPVFDPATQKIVEGTPVVEALAVRKTWVVAPLTAAELLEKAIRVDLDQARSLYSALKDGTGTDAARMRRVENVLAAVLRCIVTKEGFVVQ